MDRKKATIAATAGTLVGALGLAALALPPVAGAAPTLPQVSAEDLVQSVLTVTPPAMAGTFEVTNKLNLPSIPSGPMLGENTKARVWSDGEHRFRLSLVKPNSEQTVVNDGDTVWSYDSSSRTAHKAERGPDGKKESAGENPAEVAKQLVGAVRADSDLSVDGTATVAGQPVYTLVLTPKPDERTLLRQVRVAVDAAHRIPVQVSVLANGSADPVFQAGFSSLDFSKPEARLFQFTPPAGTKVETGADKQHKPAELLPTLPDMAKEHDSKVIGKGWERVLVTKVDLPAATTDQTQGAQDPRALAKRFGKPVNGAWGDGWEYSLPIGTALLTSDGRVAVGLVPHQVLVEALQEGK
ncbi:outer membrane lipoprotein carrier protein LolA [Pseudonocardiaceae bacterium YIM PH 21723]|nr:outer membrane lipoprotein carrier protein LolA [Pseudonocardiaceae bacterium YIM PH 21723]